MSNKQKKDDNILLIVGAALILGGIFLAITEAESLILVGFIPMPGWLLGAAAAVLGVVLLVVGIKEKNE